MKRSDIPRWLTLQEEIDYLYFCLGQIHKQMPKSVLDKMIDDATGHSAEMEKDARRIARRMKKLKKEFGEITGQPINTEMEDRILALPTPPRPSRVPSADRTRRPASPTHGRRG